MNDQNMFYRICLDGVEMKLGFDNLFNSKNLAEKNIEEKAYDTTCWNFIEQYGEKDIADERMVDELQKEFISMYIKNLNRFSIKEYYMGVDSSHNL